MPELIPDLILRPSPLVDRDVALLLALRLTGVMTTAVDVGEAYRRMAGRSLHPESVRRHLRKLASRGLVCITDGAFSLSSAGRFLLDGDAALFEAQPAEGI